MFTQGIKNMVQALRKEGFLIIFYNLRVPVLRSVRGSSLPFEEFAYCQTEEDVYHRIRNYQKPHRFHGNNSASCSTDVADVTYEGRLPSNPNHCFWASQSFKE